MLDLDLYELDAVCWHDVSQSPREIWARVKEAQGTEVGRQDRAINTGYPSINTISLAYRMVTVICKCCSEWRREKETSAVRDAPHFKMLS